MFRANVDSKNLHLHVIYNGALCELYSSKSIPPHGLIYSESHLGDSGERAHSRECPFIVVAWPSLLIIDGCSIMLRRKPNGDVPPPNPIAPRMAALADLALVCPPRTPAPVDEGILPSRRHRNSCAMFW